jgi:hypothetical protein
MTENLVPIEHIPLAAPRKNHDGEAAYLELWQRFMARCDEEALESIFRNTTYHTLHTQRQASVAASFVLWLGTNCGRGLITEADADWNRSPQRDSYRFGRDTRYLRRWEMENRRDGAINHGIRYCEAILAPERSTGAELALRDVPIVTVDDLDVIDCILVWLSTHDGQNFLKAAEARVEAASRARYLFGGEA